MTTNELFAKLHEAAANPKAQMDKYLAQGKKIVLCAPVYTPDELIHSMGFVPMGAWGADTELRRAKEYCPAFLCSIVQSALELGINGASEGASAIVIPSLCDTLKTMGENWKYAVPSIPFIPMTYPQNRKPAYGVAFTKAGYERVIRDLEKLGGKFDDAKLAQRGLRRLDIDPERVQWSFVLDFCCQALRRMRIGLGEGKMDGYPMDTCANIAVSSELMAILSVARDLPDLRRRPCAAPPL